MTYAERISLLYILRAAVCRNLRRCRRHSFPTYPLSHGLFLPPRPPPQYSLFLLFFSTTRSRSPLLISVASSFAFRVLTDLFSPFFYYIFSFAFYFFGIFLLLFARRTSCYQPFFLREIFEIKIGKSISPNKESKRKRSLHQSVI